MSLEDHIGRGIRQPMLDGRTLEATLTFGDFLKAESSQNKNLLGELGGDQLPSLNDLGWLCYWAFHRSGLFAGTYDDYTQAIDGFPDIDVGEDEEASIAGPFPQATQAESSQS